MKISDLLNTFEKTPDKNKKNSKIDFLEMLLKNIDNKKEIKDIILHSNLTKEQKNKLLQKFLLKSDKKFNLDINHSVINTLPKKNKKEEIKTDNSLLASLIQNTQNPKEIIKEIKKLPEKQQSKVVTEIKILLLNSKNPQINKIISTKKFKEAKNFSDILNLSKEYKLNLTKIAFSQIKISKNNKNTSQIPKITQNNLLNSTIKEKLKLNKPVKTTETNLKNILQSKTPKNDNNTKNSQNITIETLLKTTHTEKKLKKETQDNNSNNQFANPAINSDFKTHIISAKQTLKHFASSLKEAVENYKPPVSKLTLELHPKDLGKVEVTIKQRGENLNIQINTNNTSTVNFFTTSQQELKNSLVNMGFTNINMNFNSNQDRQKQNQQYKYSKNNKNTEDEELIIDFSYKYA